MTPSKDPPPPDENKERTAREAFADAARLAEVPAHAPKPAAHKPPKPTTPSLLELSIGPSAAGDLVLTPWYDGRDITVRIVGNADAHSHDAFHRFMVRLHDDAHRLVVDKVVVDLRDLYFMSSSCLKGFVVWLGKIETLTRRYRVHFVGNTNRHWQARSLHALQAFSTEIVTLDIS